MKKKILSEAALQALMLTAEDTVIETEASEQTEQTVEVEAAESTEAVEPEAETAETAETDVTATLQEELTELQAAIETERVDMQAKLAEAEAKVTAVEAAAQGLKDIVAGQVSKMRIGLRFAPADMTALSAGALVTEFENTAEAFMKALPVGSVVPENTVKPKAEQVVNSSVEASAYKSLGF